MVADNGACPAPAKREQAAGGVGKAVIPVYGLAVLT
jgi:hypothetical protein